VKGTVVYFGLFWVAAALGLVFFLTGVEDLASVSVAVAVASLVWALWLDHHRRR
jgi:hypothetical protein